MDPRTISEATDNIKVVMRQIDMTPGTPDSLRAAQHVAAYDPTLYQGLDVQMREASIATRIQWAAVAVEVVVNGGATGVLCADRDKQDGAYLIVWANTLPTWAGERMADAAMQYARDAAAEQGGTLATRATRVVVDYTPV